MIYYVVFLNDSPEYVAAAEEAAESAMYLLHRKFYARNKWAYSSYEQYRTIAYWHIHEVNGEA